MSHRPGPVTRRTVTPRQVLGVASLGAVLAFVDATIVNVAFPDIVADFDDTSLASISWVLNAYNIVFAAFIVAAGRIADLLVDLHRHGPARGAWSWRRPAQQPHDLRSAPERERPL